MGTNYWTKDVTRKEIITKTQIPNIKNFALFANYYNIMDKKGLSFQLDKDFDIPTNKLFKKNGFEYFVLKHNNMKELFILPNEDIVEFVNIIYSKIDNCQEETEVLNLLIEEMY